MTAVVKKRLGDPVNPTSLQGSMAAMVPGQKLPNQASSRDLIGAVAMYVVPAGVKEDPVRRWALPERVFFACGACHILAYAFLQAYPSAGFAALWIKPAEGFTGNHIVVVRNDLAFDYHGYSSWRRLLWHFNAKANRWWPGWSAHLIGLPTDVLISEPKSREYDGLWLREPRQFLHDALPRAERFLRCFPGPSE